jgi:deoxyribodipyrimidine photo-lyase
MNFPTDYHFILEQLEKINPSEYDATRNFLDGAVTRLSPYLTHGVLTLPQVRDVAYSKSGKRASYKLIFELAWREFYQRVWWERGESIFDDIKRDQEPVRERDGIPTALLHAATGIEAIDASIQSLYETGYVHNHARMWTAMLGTNVAQTHWKPLARWYYYHLLDGDLASNTLSWQWVAGTFSSKKYIANQENLNKYDKENRQHATFLEMSYEEIAEMDVPERLKSISMPDLSCVLPETPNPIIHKDAHVLLYHPWSLSPIWQAEKTNATRILVLESSHFEKFPVSPKRIDFILNLAKNIPHLQIFVGDANAIPDIANAATVQSIAHPATRHFPGEKQAPAWLFPEWQKQVMPGSFMGFWKEMERYV